MIDLRPGVSIVSGEDVVVKAVGSSLCLCIYDEVTKMLGIANIQLPKKVKEARYGGAEVIVDSLMEKLYEAGSAKENLKAKLFGGASMFELFIENTDMTLGKLNEEAVKKKLLEHGIHVVSEDIGADNARTGIFHTEDGSLEIHTLNEEPYFI